jgi:hypothetical protein
MYSLNEEANTLQITKVSGLTGKTHTREINVTQEQLDNWNSGTLIQRAMPHLSADDREFLKTGITPEEWEEAFGE